MAIEARPAGGEDAPAAGSPQFTKENQSLGDNETQSKFSRLLHRCHKFLSEVDVAKLH